MKKTVYLVVGLFLVFGLFAGPAGADDKSDVENVIKSSYFNGAFNDLDTASMRKGFHPEFAIFNVIHPAARPP